MFFRFVCVAGIIGMSIAVVASPRAANGPNGADPLGAACRTNPASRRLEPARDVAWYRALPDRIVVADRRGDQVLVTSQIGRLPLAAVRVAWRAMMPRSSRARTHRRPPRRPSSTAAPIPSSSSPSTDPSTAASRHRLEARGPFQLLGAQPRHADGVTNGDSSLAWFGTGQVVALDMRGGSCGAKHLAAEYVAVRHQRATAALHALQGPVDPALRSRVDLVLIALEARTGKLVGRRTAARAAPGTARPWLCGPRGDELVVNSSERIDGSDPGRPASCCGMPTAPRQSRIRPPSSTTASCT